MRSIRARDTMPELQLRKALYKFGYRYRLHVKGLPGRPDIVFRKLNAVIFVHGCFWHSHAGCRLAYVPKSHTREWEAKFTCNRNRDKAQIEELLALGWRVLLVWECSLRQGHARLRAIRATAAWLASPCKFAEIAGNYETASMNPVRVDGSSGTWS